MRKLGAVVLALPTLGLVYLSALLGRSALARFGVLVVALTLVASGLALGLPRTEAQAGGPTTFAPLAPMTVERSVPTDIGLNDGVPIQFAKPMNEASVAAALAVVPDTPVALVWDATASTLTVTPLTRWLPGTYYTIDVPGSVLDRNGGGVGQPVHAAFLTAHLTAGTIAASTEVDGRASPSTSFTITFDRAVKLAAVEAALKIEPAVPGLVAGDDPTDQDSHVFTLTPSSSLAGDASYTLTFAAGQSDAAGDPLAAVAPLTVRTLVGPAVVRFRPVDKATAVQPGQAVSVRFTMAMDETSTAAAFTVTANGQPVTGKVSWAENDTVLVLAPSAKLPAGATVVAAVSTAARSASGVALMAASSATFKVAAPPPPTPKPTATKKPATSKPIAPAGGGAAVGSAPWYSQETYYLRLMNCTRTGGWVTSSGACATSGPATLPPAPALKLDSGISSKVSRPYAKLLADRNILTHFADGTPGTRLARAGYTSYHWAENIGGQSDLRTHLYFQSEAPCRCDHYKNMMNPDYDRVGIGVWITSGHWRLVVDFYRP